MSEEQAQDTNDNPVEVVVPAEPQQQQQQQQRPRPRRQQQQVDEEEVRPRFHKTQLCGNAIFTINELLDPAECAKLVEVANNKGWQKSSVSGGGHGRTGNEDPVTNSFSVVHDPALAAVLWKRVREHLPENLEYLAPNPYFSSSEKGREWTPVGVYSKMRLYKYNEGEVFPEHIDYKVKREAVDTEGNRIVSQSFNTLLVYLNENFTGGQTGYWPNHQGIHCRFLRSVEKQHSKKDHQVAVTPQTGLGVVQDQNILHEALPPTKGTKYILRTDIIYQKCVPPHPKLKQKPEPREGEWETLFETSCKNYAI